ncbi:MAG: hypothetical protein D6738_03905 [Acidobacteria bacterium]|nr:MAG: hypothetical protein D6738_03905 [Acidobacteriota bacterium]
MRTDTTPPEREQRRGLALYLGGIAVCVLLIGIGAVWGNVHYTRTLERSRARQAERVRAECAERGALFVARIPGNLPATDPQDDAWDVAPVLEVPLQRQALTMPMLEQASVARVELQALTDGSAIAFRVSWEDPTQDTHVDAGRFADGVALQFPLTRNAAFTMGDRDQLVQILHWTALWQLDVDEHFQDVQDLHPNMWVDLYWFAEGPPWRLPDSFQDPRSLQWLVGYSAGNPLSDFRRRSPIEELVAEGFGTLTVQPRAVATGRGVWSDGRWRVVFSRPLATDDPLDYRFWLGGSGKVSAAVWDGSHGNVGGRKHYSNWVDFEVSP